MNAKVRLRTSLAALLVATGCGGGSDPEPPPAIPAGQEFTLSGTVRYDFVPATYDPATGEGTLAFGSSSPRPVRNARLQVWQGRAGTVLAETTTSESGGYSITFTPGPSGALTVVALAETVTPSIRVEDNTDRDALWAVGQPIMDASPTVDVRATHGWNGSAYVAANRIAAPFAILDSMYTAARRFLDLPGRTVLFPPLKVNWSPDNTNTCCNVALGQITTSSYVSFPGGGGGGEIYILGKEGVDTDEFDSHVIVHEWGHYFEDNLSRSDSPGGRHGPGDVLDPRLSFSEGYGTALAAMLLSDPIYSDTMWLGNVLRVGVGSDAETVRGDDSTPSAFSEASVIRVLYDLYDPANEAHDTIALGLGPIYDTLVGPQKTTDSLTTLASFIAGLKAHPNVAGTPDVGRIDAVLAERSIGPITDQWGAGDTGLSEMFLPSSTTSVTLAGRYDGTNQWWWIQYFVVTGTGRQVNVSSFSTSDVGLEVFRLGNRVGAADFSDLGGVTETMSFASVNGDRYVIVLTGYEPAAITYSASLSVTSP